jgi:hypothetical protein
MSESGKADARPSVAPQPMVTPGPGRLTLAA